MINVIALIGVPGTGKTTLMNHLRKHLLYHTNQFVYNGAEDFGKLVSGESWTKVTDSRTIYILGKYGDEHVFAGTDRLSMAVQPEVIKFIDRLTLDDINATIIFEGDRLTTNSFFEYCEDNDFVELDIIVLDVDHSTLQERREARAEEGNNQSEQFLRGRSTKITKIMTNFNLMSCIETWNNSTDFDLERNVRQLVTMAKQ